MKIKKGGVKNREKTGFHLCRRKKDSRERGKKTICSSGGGKRLRVRGRRALHLENSGPTGITVGEVDGATRDKKSLVKNQEQGRS